MFTFEPSPALATKFGFDRSKNRRFPIRSPAGARPRPRLQGLPGSPLHPDGRFPILGSIARRNRLAFNLQLFYLLNFASTIAFGFVRAETPRFLDLAPPRPASVSGSLVTVLPASDSPGFGEPIGFVRARSSKGERRSRFELPRIELRKSPCEHQNPPFYSVLRGRIA